jgi:hypothetical protein
VDDDERILVRSEGEFESQGNLLIASFLGLHDLAAKQRSSGNPNAKSIVPS